MTQGAAVPRLLVERSMYRQVLAVPGESLATYALLKLIPSGDHTPRTPLHLALALSAGRSMAELDGTGRARMARVRDAVLEALGKLHPDDRVTLIAFADGARLVLADTPASERDRIAGSLEGVTPASPGAGGSALHEAVRLALDQLASLRAEVIRRVVALTDSETEGDDACRVLAGVAAGRGVSLTLMGMGPTFDDRLLREMARLSDGRWCYLDAGDPNSARAAFAGEFGRLRDTAILKAELLLRTVRDVRVKRVRRVGPDLQELLLLQEGNRVLRAPLGPLTSARPAKHLLDLSLPRRPDGRYVIAQAEVRFDAGGGVAGTTGTQALEVTYSAGTTGPVNAEVARAIDDVHIYELNSLLQESAAAGNQAEMQRAAQQIARKAEQLGPRSARRSAVARQALVELADLGHVSRNTLLALEDAVRRVDEPPTPAGP